MTLHWASTNNTRQKWTTEAGEKENVFPLKGRRQMTKHNEEGEAGRERHNRKAELEKWEKYYVYALISHMLDICTKGATCHQQVCSGKRETCISTFLNQHNRCMWPLIHSPSTHCESRGSPLPVPSPMLLPTSTHTHLHSTVHCLPTGHTVHLNNNSSNIYSQAPPPPRDAGFLVTKPALSVGDFNDLCQAERGELF